MESNRVLLVVDGVRMNNAIYRKGHLQSSISVAPNMLDKTEVVFGPSSVLYGSDALGGVIHYYTKTPKLSAEEEVKSQFFSRFSSVNQEITSHVSAELRFSNWASLTSISFYTARCTTLHRHEHARTHASLSLFMYICTRMCAC